MTASGNNFSIADLTLSGSSLGYTGQTILTVGMIPNRVRSITAFPRNSHNIVWHII